MATSYRPSRLLVPPPHRTAYFSSARIPGVVLRVSSTIAPDPRSSSAHRRVWVATPEVRDTTLRAVRSATSVVRSVPPSRSSSRARATRRRASVVGNPWSLTARGGAGGGGADLPLGHAERASFGAPDGEVGEPPRVVPFREVRAHVPPAGLLTQVCHEGQCLTQVEEVRRLPRPGAGLGPGRGPRSKAGQALERLVRGLRRPHRAGTARHGPLELQTVRRVEHGGLTGARGRLPERQLPCRDPRGDVVGDPVREDEPLEERVRGQPVGPVDPGARALATRIQP